jgi:hypothetical protein
MSEFDDYWWDPDRIQMVEFGLGMAKCGVQATLLRGRRPVILTVEGATQEMHGPDGTLKRVIMRDGTLTMRAPGVALIKLGLGIVWSALRGRPHELPPGMMDR